VGAAGDSSAAATTIGALDRPPLVLSASVIVASVIVASVIVVIPSGARAPTIPFDLQRFRAGWTRAGEEMVSRR